MIDRSYPRDDDPRAFAPRGDLILPRRSLRLHLLTSGRVDLADIAKVVEEQGGSLTLATRQSSLAGRTSWQIAFEPSDIENAYRTLLALLDLGQVSFAFGEGI